MKRIYTIGYKVEIKEKMRAKRNQIISEAGKFWEHAINDPIFEYELEDGDVVKAKAVANVLRILNGKVPMRKIRQTIKEVV